MSKYLLVFAIIYVLAWPEIASQAPCPCQINIKFFAKIQRLSI
jgi:hypothetical protein